MRKPRGKIESLEDLLRFCHEPDPETGCIEWKYGKHTHGYGRYRIGKKMETTHRMSYQFANPDEDISELEVCHKCDNPPCCNPDHLFSGTHADNMNDMEHKGRSNKPGPVSPPKGEKHHNVKLSKEDILDIRRLYSDTELTLKNLGDRYGVCFQQISRIVNNKQWKE